MRPCIVLKRKGVSLTGLLGISEAGALSAVLSVIMKCQSSLSRRETGQTTASPGSSCQEGRWLRTDSDFQDWVGDLPKSQLAKGWMLRLNETLIWRNLLQFSHLRNSLFSVSLWRDELDFVIIKAKIWDWFPLDHEHPEGGDCCSCAAVFPAPNGRPGPCCGVLIKYSLKYPSKWSQDWSNE